MAFYSPSDWRSCWKRIRAFPTALRQIIRESPFGDLLLASLRDLSPVNWVRKDSPPFLLIHGTRDVLSHSINPKGCATPCERRAQAARSIRSMAEATACAGGNRNADITAYKQVMVRWLNSKLRTPKQN